MLEISDLLTLDEYTILEKYKLSNMQELVNNLKSIKKEIQKLEIKLKEENLDPIEKNIIESQLKDLYKVKESLRPVLQKVLDVLKKELRIILETLKYSSDFNIKNYGNSIIFYEVKDGYTKEITEFINKYNQSISSIEFNFQSNLMRSISKSLKQKNASLLRICLEIDGYLNAVINLIKDIEDFLN